MFKYSVIAELYDKKLIPKSLLFQLSEVIESNHQQKHRKKIDAKLELIACLPATIHMAAVDRFLHPTRRVSENAFFRDLDESIVKEVLQDSRLMTVPAGEYIYQAKQPADAGSSM